MKRIIASKRDLILLSTVSLSFFFLSMVGLMQEAFGLVEEKGAGLLFFFLFGAIDFLFLWTLNREACVVWVDNGVVKRKGLLWGFYKECPISSIKAVKIRSLYKTGDCIFLIDGYNSNRFGGYSRLKKDCFIYFRKTKKNIAFLRTFWSGSVEQWY